MTYQFIETQQKEYPVKTLCRVLRVSVSGYDAWCKRPISVRKQSDAVLVQEIRRIYETCRHVYGSPRVHAELQEQGMHCGRKRVERLMRQQGLRAVQKGHKTRTTDSRHTNPVAENLLQRDFSASAANRKWVADITGVWTRDQLALSRRCPGCLLSSSCRVGNGSPTRGFFSGRCSADGVGATASQGWTSPPL